LQNDKPGENCLRKCVRPECWLKEDGSGMVLAAFYPGISIAVLAGKVFRDRTGKVCGKDKG
jgi:hypothetical protein